MKFNPFRPGNIVGPGMFVGRIDEITTIEQSLFQTKHGNPQNFLIQGERGIGKSSLLMYVDMVASKGFVLNSGQAASFLVLSVDMGGVVEQIDIVNTIGRELRTKLSQRNTLTESAKNIWNFLSKWEVLGVRYHSGVREADPDNAREEMTDQIAKLMQAESDNLNGIVLLIDEADSPSPDAQLGSFLKLFTERLTKQGCNSVVIGLAGLPSIISKLKQSHESSARLFTILNLEPLSTSERLRVVRMGLAEAESKNGFEVTITDDAIDMLSELSEGYPNFVQQFAYSAFEADSDNCIDIEDVKRGAYGESGALAQLGLKYFNEMYHTKIASEDYRKVLNAMAAHGDGWVSRRDIIQESEVTDTSVSNALNALKERKIIWTEDGRRGFYRLPTKSFAAWINAFRSLPVAAERDADTLF
jgi:AAA ATPase domain